MQRRNDDDSEGHLEFEAFELQPQPLRLMPGDDVRRRMRENMARGSSLAQEVAARFEEQRIQIEDMKSEIAWLKERVTGQREARGPKKPTHEGPLYYGEGDTFQPTVEAAVEYCVKELMPITVHNVGQNMEPVKISENTLRQRLIDHGLIKKGGSAAQYLRSLAEAVRRKKGHFLFGVPLVGALALGLIDQVFISDPVVAQAVDHVHRMFTHACH